MTTSGIIYGLHNGDGVIRYIGYTTMLPAKRLYEHKYRSRIAPNRHVSKWIQKHNEEIFMVTLESYSDTNVAFLHEREIARIAQAKADGWSLVNGTTGGDGGATRTGMKHTEETKLKMSEASKGRVKSAEHRAKLGAAQLGKKRGPMSAEHRAKIGAGNRGKPSNSGHIRFHVNQNIIKEGCKYCG